MLVIHSAAATAAAAFAAAAAQLGWAVVRTQPKEAAALALTVAALS
jgi:hypothetical protein